MKAQNWVETQSLRVIKAQCPPTFSSPRRPLRDDRHDITDCPVPGPVRQAAARPLRSTAHQLRRGRRAAEGGREVYGLVAGFVRCLVDRREPGKVRRHTLPTCSASGSSASPAVIPTATTPSISRPTPSTSCCSGATRGQRPPGLATDDLAVRELRHAHRNVSDGARAGHARHRTPCAAARRPSSADHHRPGPDRRPHAWRPASVVLQRLLRQLVLPAAVGVPDLRPRAGAVPVCGGAASRQRPGHQGCSRARSSEGNWTPVDRKMLWSPAASSSQQCARVLTGVKARRFAPPPLRGADGPDAGSAHARPDWLLLTMPTHTPPTCCGRRPVQDDTLSGDR